MLLLRAPERFLWICRISCLLLLSMNAIAAKPTLVVRRVQQQSDGVLLWLNQGQLKIQICTDSIIHIVYTPSGSFPDNKNPMVLANSWSGVPFQVNHASKLLNTWPPAPEERKDDEISVSTTELKITISSIQGSLKFLDAKGRTLLEEPAGWQTRQMVPAQVNGEKTYHATQLFSVQSGESFYGLGQHQAGVWNYNGESVELLQDNSNISVPFYTSSLGYGLLWNNASVSRFNDRFARSLYLYSEVADSIDYYFLYGPELDRLIAEYRMLTGPVPLFGRWAYGFWQCKNRYESQQEILDVAAKYRELAIPIDNIVQDWFWWTKMGSHIFNAKYPDPTEMVGTLHREHFHVMISVWPFFVPGTSNYEAFEARHLFMAKVDPSSPWLPGAGLYDALSVEGRTLYWKQISESLFQRGFDAWWLDTTEPETVSQEKNRMLSAHTGMGSGARFANIFGLMTTTGVYESQREESDDKRVFILTRSGTAGMQRNAAAVWSGDIFSTWQSLKRQIPAGLNYELSGLPYWTTDIGGFISGNPDDPAYRELFVRWFEYGAFCPIFRVHGTRGNNHNELWSYGSEARSILIKYDRLRYRLLPYIYSVAWRVTHDGYTPMRPLVMDFPSDERARSIGDQFLFGPSLLVSPVTDAEERTRLLYLPEGDWYDFWTGSTIHGSRSLLAEAPLETIPLYVRAGAIIPMGPDLQYSDEKTADPIELRIYAGTDGDFVLYEDEGDSYRYEKGVFATIPIHWNDSERKVTIGAREGTFPGMLKGRTFHVVLVKPQHGIGVESSTAAETTVSYSGEAASVTIP